MTTIQGAMPPLALMAQSLRGLTETQQQGLDEVLSKYDPGSISDDDARALTQQIKDLGIQPGRGLTEALGSAGIDARGLGAQAGAGGPEGKGPPGGGKGGPGGPGGGGGPGGAKGASGPDSAAVETLQSVVEQLQESLEEGETDEDFTTLLLEKLEEAGLDTSEPILDYRV